MEEAWTQNSLMPYQMVIFVNVTIYEPDRVKTNVISLVLIRCGSYIVTTRFIYCHIAIHILSYFVASDTMPFIYGSLSKNGGIQKGKIIKKYSPKFHFFSNIFINTNMEKIYGKYVQFKNMYNVSIVNYMDGTLAKMSVQSQTNFLIKNRQFKKFSKFKGVPLEILLKTLMGMNLGLFGCGTCKRNTLKIDVQ